MTAPGGEKRTERDGQERSCNRPQSLAQRLPHPAGYPGPINLKNAPARLLGLQSIMVKIALTTKSW